MRRLLALVALPTLLIPAALSATATPARRPAPAAPARSHHHSRPPIKRVFVYVMENTSFNDVAGSEDAPYLNSLIPRFALATDYVATGHASLDNYLAMTSGQPPNPATSGDCFLYATPLCLQNVDNIADQIEAKGFTWKGYMDSMEAPCQHTDENTVEESQTGYTPRHNPFVYYRSIVDDQARCEAHVVPMTELWKDMAARRVPNYSFITPDTCHDGHDSGDACEYGGGVKEADVFASQVVPRILADRSWKKGGLLLLTFDEGGVADDDKPASADGGSPDFGGRIFTLLVSRNVDRGAEIEEPLNHYSQLKTVEDIFCLDYLAGAGLPGTRSFVDALHQERCALQK